MLGLRGQFFTDKASLSEKRKMMLSLLEEAGDAATEITARREAQLRVLQQDILLLQRRIDVYSSQQAHYDRQTVELSGRVQALLSMTQNLS